MSADVVRVRCSEVALDVEVLGRGTLDQCPALREWFQQQSQQSARPLRVYLDRCTHLDSTFIGTLLILNRQLQARAGMSFTIASLSAECRRSLEQMHVLNQLTIENTASDSWQELHVQSDARSSRGCKQNVVEAHQELAQLGGQAQSQFGELAARLAEEWKATEKPAPAGSLHDTIGLD